MKNDLHSDEGESERLERDEANSEPIDRAADEASTHESQLEGRDESSECSALPWRRVVWLAMGTTASGGLFSAFSTLP